MISVSFTLFLSLILSLYFTHYSLSGCVNHSLSLSFSFPFPPFPRVFLSLSLLSVVLPFMVCLSVICDAIGNGKVEINQNLTHCTIISPYSWISLDDTVYNVTLPITSILFTPLVLHLSPVFCNVPLFPSIQHNTTQHNTIQYITTSHNTTQHTHTHTQQRRILDWVIHFWARTALKLSLCQPKVYGLENLPANNEVECSVVSILCGVHFLYVIWISTTHYHSNLLH